MEIVITGTRMSVEEGHRAKKAPASELPRLTDEQREVAKGFGMSDEQYARMVLAQQYGAERLRKSADTIAGIIENELPKLVPGVELLTFIYGLGFEPSRILLRHQGKVHTFKFPADDDSEDIQAGCPPCFAQAKRG